MSLIHGAFKPMNFVFKTHATLASMSNSQSFEISKFSDQELIVGFQDLVIEEREKLSLTLEYIAELDRRKLFFHYPSLRSFLVEEYEQSVRDAGNRISVSDLQPSTENGITRKKKLSEQKADIKNNLRPRRRDLTTKPRNRLKFNLEFSLEIKLEIKKERPQESPIARSRISSRSETAISAHLSMK